MISGLLATAFIYGMKKKDSSDKQNQIWFAFIFMKCYFILSELKILYFEKLFQLFM